MSPSWTFPARAEPSYGSSDPSRGTSIFELKPSWQKYKVLIKNYIKILTFCLYHDFNQSYDQFFELLYDNRYFLSQIHNNLQT